MADESDAIIKLSNAVANLTTALARALAENRQLRQTVEVMQRDVNRHNRDAASGGETALCYGGPGS